MDERRGRLDIIRYHITMQGLEATNGKGKKEEERRQTSTHNPFQSVQEIRQNRLMMKIRQPDGLCECEIVCVCVCVSLAHTQQQQADKCSSCRRQKAESEGTGNDCS
jgi:hypothetical protein